VDGRPEYRSGYDSRSLVAQVGTLELGVSCDRPQSLSTMLLKRFRRSQNVLMRASARICIQGASTPKVKEVTDTAVTASLPRQPELLSSHAVNKALILHGLYGTQRSPRQDAVNGKRLS
jgi:hypothetical protein